MNSNEFAGLNFMIAIVFLAAVLVTGGMVFHAIVYTINDYRKWRKQFPGHSFLTGRRKR